MLAQWPSWLFVLGAALNTSLANVLLKQSRLKEHAPGLMGLLLNPWFIGGMGLFGFSVILFSKGLEHLPVSLAYPVQAGFAFALLIVFSAAFLGEPVGMSKLVGILVILAGMFLVSR